MLASIDICESYVTTPQVSIEAAEKDASTVIAIRSALNIFYNYNYVVHIPDQICSGKWADWMFPNLAYNSNKPAEFKPLSYLVLLANTGRKRLSGA